MQIRYSPKFGRQYKKLTKEVRSRAKKKEVIFRTNPFDPRLKTHKLHGVQGDLFSFSIDYSHRIIFEFITRGIIVFYEIGTHDIYE